MKCPQCHSEVSEQAKLCPECGANLSEAVAKSAPRQSSEKSAKPGMNSNEAPEGKPATASQGRKGRSVPVLLPIFVIGLALVAALFIYKRHDFGTRNEPFPVNPYFISSDEDHLFDELDEAIDFTVKGKYFFLAAQAYEHGKVGPVPLVSPPATETQGSNDPAFKAAENYSLALEHFNEAKRKVERVSSAPLRPNYVVCRQTFIDVTEKYSDAARIFNNRAKSMLQKDQDVEETFPLSDAIAKMELAEKMMADFLTQGCNGDYFRYLRMQKPVVTSKVFGNYRDFFSADFESIRPALEMLLKNTPNTTPVPVSMLTR